MYVRHHGELQKRLVSRRIHSRLDPKKLLHVIHSQPTGQERTEIAPENQFLQLCMLRLEKGRAFRPHQHIWKATPHTQCIAQESWVVLQGRARVTYYDTDGEYLTSEEIGSGDITMTFDGGHAYEILEDDTVVYEYKTGPYQGQALDKRFLDQ